MDGGKISRRKHLGQGSLGSKTNEILGMMRAEKPGQIVRVSRYPGLGVWLNQIRIFAKIGQGKDRSAKVEDSRESDLSLVRGRWLSQGGKASFSKVDWVPLAACGFWGEGEDGEEGAGWRKVCNPWDSGRGQPLPGCWASRVGWAGQADARSLVPHSQAYRDGGRARPTPRWAPPSSAWVYGVKAAWPLGSHGRSCLRHQGHVPF